MIQSKAKQHHSKIRDNYKGQFTKMTKDVVVSKDE